jgi:3-hydroxyisobutyrate dehydrogenase-like beta-hydroxyacid dehydrogenase
MNSKTARRIGFAGVGRMGEPIARNLLRHGFSLTVWNRTPDRVEALLAEGARWAASPATLASEANVVMTSLADPEAIEAVYFGPDGILSGVAPGSVVIDLSTVSPTLSRRVAAEARERGAEYLDAPVAGSVPAAAEQRLAIMVGGDRPAYDSCVEIFEAIGQASFHIGDSGAGSTMKLVSNAILATMVQALAEGLSLGEKAGIPIPTMLEVIGNSSAAAPVVKAKTQAISERSHVPAAFTLQLMQKDLWLALSMANELTVPMPTTALAYDMVLAANASGMMDHDFAAVTLLMEELAGLDLPSTR